MELTESLNRTLEKLAKGRPAAKDPMQDAIEGLVGYVTKLQSVCSECDQLISMNAQHSAFLLSRKTDISRQVTEARRFVDTSISSQGGVGGASDILASQPLDRDSEMRKRQLSTQYMQVKKLITNLEERLKLITGICSADAHDGRVNLLKTMMTSYNKAKLFAEESDRINRKVVEMAKKVPLPASETMQSPASRRRKPAKIAPLPLSTGAPSSTRKHTKPSNEDKKRQAGARWGAMETSLRSFLHSQEATRLGVRELPLTIVNAPNSVRSKAPARSPAQNLLLPASTPSGFSAAAQNKPTAVALFSPPSSMKTRSGWDKVSELDRAKQVALSMPADIQEITFSGAAGDALAQYDTTPEKVRASLGVTKRGASPKPAPRQSSSSRDAKPESASEKKTAPPSAAAFPPMASKAPSKSFDKKNSDSGAEIAKKPDSSSFPPMSKLAPAPFSSSIADQSLKAPSMSVKDALSTASQGLGDIFSGKEKVDPTATAKSAFGSMGGLGSSLFGTNTEDSKTPTKLGLPTGASGFGNTPLTGTSEPDYTSILTDFYQTHNPARIADVGKNLTKYKVGSRVIYDFSGHIMFVCAILI